MALPDYIVYPAAVANKINQRIKKWKNTKVTAFLNTQI
jgi:hypothetical protein